MYEEFIESYQTFERSEVENPLLETLHLFDLLSGGRLKQTGLSGWNLMEINFQTLVQKRKQGIPLEHILGRTTFMGRTFFCSPETFIPTDHTRLLAEAGLDFIREKEKNGEDVIAADIGTGCGNLAVTLALNSSRAVVFASDIAASAVEVARKNIHIHDIEARVFLYCGDLFAPLQAQGYQGKLDLIVCNPPYIPTGSIQKLPGRLGEREPKLALDGGPYGIDFYRRLIRESVRMLKPEGILLFELSGKQEKIVTRLVQNRGYCDIRCLSGCSGIRVMHAQKKMQPETAESIP